MRSPNRRRLLAILICAFVIGNASPVSANDWAPGPIYTTYTIFYPYLNPTDLNFYSPPTMRVQKTGQLQSGLSGSNICRNAVGQVMYQLTTNPTWVNLGSNFGNWNLDYAQTWAGDQATVQNSSDWVIDANADGQVMQDYQLSFTSVISGRSVTITYSSAIAYGSSCTSDNYSTSTVVRS